MCICLYKPKDVIITKKVLKTCFENNPHGAGMAYASKEGDKIIIDKGYFYFREFWKKFQAIQNNKSMLIHFRVATSGVIDKNNCHAWRFDEQHALIHNGTVAGKIGIFSKDCSDTGLFVNRVLKPIFEENNKVWQSKAFQWIVEQAMGRNNKFVLLDNKENVVIFNENEGEWDNNVWFSNDTYKNARKSLAKISDSWFEQRDGVTVLVKRKGNKQTLSYVDNPLNHKTETDDKKIMKFVQNQIGAHSKIPIKDLNAIEMAALI